MICIGIGKKKRINKNGSKKAFIQRLTIVFNCHSDVALEMMRFIPTEAINALVDDLDLITGNPKEVK